MSQKSSGLTLLELLRRAEDNLAQQPPRQEVSEPDLRRLLHELQVRQIELEMQTNELLDANETLSLKSYAINHVKEAVFLIDPAGTILYANEEAARSLGYSRKELVGLRVHDFDPEINETTWSAHWRRLETEGSEKFEGSHRRKDGSLFPVDVSANLFTYAGKDYNLALTRDITMRKESEAQLLASERKFRTLAENIPDHIIRYDAQGRRTYVSASLTRLIGVSAETILGMSPEETPKEFRANTDVDEIGRRLRRVLKTGDRQDFELKVYHATDGPQTHSISLVAERDDADNIVGALAIGRDITDRVHIAQDLTESRDMLRQLAARRDTAREEERKHMAREIHDELGQVLTTLRLELATLHFLFGDAQPAIDGTCQHLIGIVDQTIQVVRNITKSLRPAVLDMGLIPSLDWLVAEFRNRSGIDCQINASIPEDSHDETRNIALFRILQEALTNVSRYAEARSVVVTLTAGSDGCRLIVNDDGKGFDIENPSPHSFGLLGIRERALMLGGVAHIQSAPGHGTTIEIFIPRLPEERDQP